MAAPRIRLRERADRDIDEVATGLLRTAGESVALDAVDELERTMHALARSPHLGSLTFSVTLSIPELRVLRTRRFGLLVFYVPVTDGIDVWRVLHERRGVIGAFQPDVESL